MATTDTPQGNLQQILREEFGKRTIEDTELPPYFASSLNPAKPLRPYQRLCFQYFINYWERTFDAKEPQPHLLFHMATGSGKTLIMAGLMLYLYEKGYRNFLFHVGLTNIIEKTRDNFLNTASPKYMFAEQINIGCRQVEIRLVDNFQYSNPDCINLCMITPQALGSLNDPKENAVTYDDFEKYSVVVISDEAHHNNAATKRSKKAASTSTQTGIPTDGSEANDWESTITRIFNTPHDEPQPNVWLEFTATADLGNPLIAQKYRNKIIFDYPLREFRNDKYSKEVEVVQTDLPPMQRAMQAVVLSQYKRKLFTSIGQDIKPVVMLKSRNTADNKEAFDQFAQAIKRLRVADLHEIRSGARDDLAAAFAYFDQKGISLDNLLLELKEDFAEEKLLIVDSKNKVISAEKQIKLNTLEAHDNEVRVVFAVDMLNEGWDVLNLFDIVRLYDTRDAKNGKPGRTTMQEAQLIGRGARYMPFTLPGSDLPAGKRKFDNDTSNPLRTIEKLHYHSAHNPRYIDELHKALVITGMQDPKTRELRLTLKNEFKDTALYQKGYVFANSREEYYINGNQHTIGNDVLKKTFNVWLHSGQMRSDLIFDDSKPPELSQRYIRIKMHGLGRHVVRAAINRFDRYHFSSLHAIFPNLRSIKEFIESPDYLAELNISVYTVHEQLDDFTQREKLQVAIEVLRQVEPMLARDGKAYRGSQVFEPLEVKKVFRDHTLRISTEGSPDREYGRSMREATTPLLAMDLSLCQWHAYNDCYGTSEEKCLIKYIESIYPKLKEKYDNIYLVRNEKDLQLWSFDTGDAFEPDYVLFMQRKDDSGLYDYIQIFIEPKGQHLRAADKWKETYLTSLHDKAILHFSTPTSKFEVWGMPFFTNDLRSTFDTSFREALL